MSSSKVRLASSIIAHSSPSISIPWPAKRAGRRARLVAELLEPERVGQRRAGSMVTTGHALPARASPIASAADVVVLPTPPEPATMQTDLPSSRSATLTGQLPGERASSRGPARRRRRTAA
jgi:hypothetical protein